MRTTMLALQWRRRLRIDNGNNAIVTRATITIATTAKPPAHWRQQCHHDKGNNASLTTSLVSCWNQCNCLCPNFPSGKGRSGQRDAKQLCTPLDWLGGGGLTSRRGKSHICHFSLATNLILFFLRCFCILCVSHKKCFFSGGK
jgi:hypothetical protein